MSEHYYPESQHGNKYCSECHVPAVPKTIASDLALERSRERAAAGASRSSPHSGSRIGARKSQVQAGASLGTWTKGTYLFLALSQEC